MTKAENLAQINALTDNAFADFDIDSVNADTLAAAAKAAKDAAEAADDSDEAIDLATLAANSVLNPADPAAPQAPAPEAAETSGETVLAYLGDHSISGSLLIGGIKLERGIKTARPLSVELFNSYRKQYGIEDCSAEELAAAKNPKGE